MPQIYIRLKINQDFIYHQEKNSLEQEQHKKKIWKIIHVSIYQPLHYEQDMIQGPNF